MAVEIPILRDLLQECLIPKYILGICSEKDIDSSPLPLMVRVLPLINKQFYRAIKNGRLTQKLIDNFGNLPRLWQCQQKLMRTAAALGSVSLMEFFYRRLRFPMKLSYISDAAQGFVSPTPS